MKKICNSCYGHGDIPKCANCGKVGVQVGDETPATAKNSPDQGQKTLIEILDAMEARANAATPGPWSIKHAAQLDRRCVHSGRNIVDGQLIGTAIPEPDATFIAAARSEVPALVKALRYLRDEIVPNVSDQTMCLIDADVAQLLREPEKKQDLEEI